MVDEKKKKVINLYKEKTKKECYKIEFEEGEPSIMDNKIGGKPYLPIGEPYPTGKNGEKLPLLFQVNLKNIDLEGYPQEGILEFFMGDDYPCEYKIKYFKDIQEYQENVESYKLSISSVDSFKVKLTKSVEYMPINDYRFEKTISPIVSEIFPDNIDCDWNLVMEEALPNLKWSFGGYADFTQADPRLYEDRGDECLLKLDSFNQIEIGDAGIVSVLISKKDIENNKFENGKLDWDCG